MHQTSPEQVLSLVMEIASASPVPVAANVTSSFGLLLIGNTLTFVLCGVSCMQLFMYYSGYPNDSYFMKITVFVIWAFTTTKPILQMSSLWNVLIVGWGSSSSFEDPMTGMLHATWMGAVTISVVQSIFMWRIYVLGDGKPWTKVVIGLIGTLSLTQFVATITYQAIAFRSTNTLDAVNETVLRVLLILNQAVTFPADILICISLLWLLLSHGIPKYKSTRGLLFRSIIVTVNSGFWTAILALIDLVFICVMPANFAYCVIEFPLDSLYLVSLLSNLNARSYIRGRPTEWNEYLSSIRIDQRSTTIRENSVNDGKHGTAYVLSDFQGGKDKPSPSVTDTEGTAESNKVGKDGGSSILDIMVTPS